MSRIGDIYADRDLFAKAAPYWDRIPRVAPGQSSGYLEAASIYWDYFDFDNALRLLNEGRKKLGDENLYSYEAGAIYENQRDYPRAIDEYVKGRAGGGANSPADIETARIGPQAEAARPGRPANRQADHSRPILPWPPYICGSGCWKRRTANRTWRPSSTRLPTALLPSGKRKRSKLG